MITQCYEKPFSRPKYGGLGRALVAVALFALFSAGRPALGQTFESGSTGADGALNLTTPGTIVFDPVALGLADDGDNVFQFTTITIAADVTVKIPATAVNGPVFWLAAGDVQIDGIVDLNGEDGQSSQGSLDVGRIPSVPGAGGFGGGTGGTVSTDPTPGNGPGGGKTFFSSSLGFREGGGAGHATAGGSSASSSIRGLPYGNNFLVPLVGGSGGAGGGFGSGFNGGGGGAGGGALLIAGSTAIRIGGTIQANGGDGGVALGGDVRFGGGGSGGSIRLIAPSVDVSGTLSAIGGAVVGSSLRNSGSVGRIRLEGFQKTFTGTANPPADFGAPFGLFLPSDPPPLVRVVSVGGVAVPSSATGSFEIPDVSISTGDPVEVEIEARSIPLGTVVQLHLLSETGSDQTVDSTPLTGSISSSTATATVTIPAGFSRGFVRATWAPSP